MVKLRWVAVAGSFALACGPVVDIHEHESGGTATGDPTSPSSTLATTDPTGATTAATSSTTSSDSSSTSSDTGGDEACGPLGCPCDICDPDGGSESDCDLWAQDCLPGSKCMPWANDGGFRWNATRCSPIAAVPSQLGDPCFVSDSAVSGIDSCDLGLMCMWVDAASGVGTCVANCGGSEANPTCADPANTCVIDFEGTIILCLPPCDPLAQDCDEGTCYLVGSPHDDGFACGSSLVPPVADGESCEHDWDCMPGSMCADGEHASACADSDCCTPICELALPDPCGAGLVCHPFTSDRSAPPELLNRGYCALP